MHRADTGSHTAAEQADFIQRRLRIDFRQRDLGADRIFAEGAGAHVVIDWLTVVGETGGAVRHQAFALGGAHGLTEVGFAGFTELTLAALRSVQRDHVVAGLKAGHAFTHFHHHAAPFVPQHRREHPFRILTGQGKRIGMADARMGDLDQHFAFFGGATSISTIFNGWPGPNATAARDFIMSFPCCVVCGFILDKSAANGRLLPYARPADPGLSLPSPAHL